MFVQPDNQGHGGELVGGGSRCVRPTRANDDYTSDIEQGRGAAASTITPADREVLLLATSREGRPGGRPVARRLSHILEESCCHPCERSLRVFEKTLLLVVGVELPDPFPPALEREVKKLRCPGLIAATTYCIGLAVQVWCVARGWELLLHGIPPACQSLYGWLLGYCAGLTLLPFCCTVAGPLVAFWAAMGILVRSHMMEACQEASPGIYNFVDQVLYSSLATCAFVCVSWIFLWRVKSTANHLERIFGTNGPTDRGVVALILAEPMPQVRAGTECCICLECAEPTATAAATAAIVASASAAATPTAAAAAENPSPSSVQMQPRTTTPTAAAATAATAAATSTPAADSAAGESPQTATARAASRTPPCCAANTASSSSSSSLLPSSYTSSALPPSSSTSAAASQLMQQMQQLRSTGLSTSSGDAAAGLVVAADAAGGAASAVAVEATTTADTTSPASDATSNHARSAAGWRQLRCGHIFHERCLIEWLSRARKCPLCRMDLHARYLLNARLGNEDIAALEH
mmetsp:Transcript_62893/g.132769  ORF Transcript_62893/g.132769 Transcript_62893/m.132769 type:complete len:522 (-) Transcript_62893:51-1616(-)|eukprot:CAMPEP_0206486834 /NCGR_PEP_ID=MMETSP0324_2-20121206/41264_1 /ASSEMBLY_ACC=CAM_ASM_000836 /TAXON_ID=2866 /ORGANISM="Crypthecodinium cohnii, Strain Seligo" /LENGTH=521 /DNA_ID=CAMNT_0053965165 /DNA_START=83 /DNA_END=1648 /DNA_ORIENTATION=-